MVRDAIKESLDAVEEKLLNVVESDVDVLNEASYHIIESGGKRLRPRLVFLTYLAAGGKDLELVVGLASAVELVHTATLVHDDINDHSLTRRGSVTVHARWGRTFALLSGDYLFAKVYELMAPYGSQINMLMAEATVDLVEGETLQAAAAKSGKMDRETYKEIISRKTASLFRAAGEMGALLADADEEVVDALRDYSHNLGLAFQIADDVLDIVGDPDKMGKPVGGDLIKGAGAMAIQNGRGQLRSEVSVAESDADPLQQLMIRLRESGAVDTAREEARRMARRARQALYRIPDSPYREELDELIDTVVERER